MSLPPLFLDPHAEPEPTAYNKEDWHNDAARVGMEKRSYVREGPGEGTIEFKEGSDPGFSLLTVGLSADEFADAPNGAYTHLYVTASGPRTKDAVKQSAKFQATFKNNNGGFNLKVHFEVTMCRGLTYCGYKLCDQQPEQDAGVMGYFGRSDELLKTLATYRNDVLNIMKVISEYAKAGSSDIFPTSFEHKHCRNCGYSRLYPKRPFAEWLRGERN